jgi:hypothetical protein
MAAAYAQWCTHLHRIIDPALDAFAKKSLKTRWEPQFPPGALPRNTKECAALELIARIMLGCAPIFHNTELLETQARLVNAVDIAFSGYLEMAGDEQRLIEFGNIAWAFLRAPVFWTRIADHTREILKRHMIHALSKYKPHNNNWLLYAAAIHAFLGHGADARKLIEQFELFYVGDGWYKDGSVFHMDYYNSFVITPLLVDLYKRLGMKEAEKTALQRLGKQACWLERLVGVDGTFPLFGRSIVYRTAVFHALAYVAYLGAIPEDLCFSQIRCGLLAVLDRVFAVGSGVFDAAGFLQLGEPANIYSNSGSCYFALTIFAPLGLPSSHAFWTEPDKPWTQSRAWGSAKSEDLS